MEEPMWTPAAGSIIAGVLIGVSGGCLTGKIIASDTKNPPGSSSGSQLVIQPKDATVAVTTGLPASTLAYTASVDGSSVAATWQIDDAQIGSINSTGVFTPAGTGGTAQISASYQSLTATTSVTVVINDSQLGDPAYGKVTAPFGPGGYGGVGGNGPGSPATPGQQTTLQGTPVNDSAVQILYPYDGTVWPKGLLAPLLQWNPGAHSFDSVYVHMQSSIFEYKGFFGPPSSSPFVNLPIPQAAWEQATNAAALAADTLAVTLIFGEGGNAYGPYVLHWKVAATYLDGDIYYNSYGTSLVRNSGEGSYPSGTGPAFGAATLVISYKTPNPKVVAGVNSTDKSGCRVCHVVAATSCGSMITQHGDDYMVSSLYNLSGGSPETTLSASGLTFSALSPDETMLLSDTGGFGYTNGGTTQLYSLPSTNVLAAVGIPAGFQATVPTFSPDGKHVAFVFWGGPGADQRSIASMDFDKSSLTFSGLQVLATPSPGPAVFPSYLPWSTAIIYEAELVKPPQ
jgi:hypothetical protein